MAKINSTWEQIENDCEIAYSKGGLQAVYDIINKKYPNDKFQDAYCDQCDTTVPIIEGFDNCLACGNTIS